MFIFYYNYLNVIHILSLISFSIAFMIPTIIMLPSIIMTIIVIIMSINYNSNNDRNNNDDRNNCVLIIKTIITGIVIPY